MARDYGGRMAKESRDLSYRCLHIIQSIHKQVNLLYSLGQWQHTYLDNKVTTS